jgi:hypothetical protein
MRLRPIRSRVTVLPCFFLFSSIVLASAINIGDTDEAPDVFPNPGGSVTVWGDLSGTFDLGNGITGTWEDAVVVDPFHTFCPTCLAFAFQVSLDPTAGGAIFSIGSGLFGNFAADAGYIDQGSWTPTLVRRGPGNIVFNLIHNAGTPSAAALSPGGMTDFLVIATDATNFDTKGAMSLQNFVFSTGTSGPAGHLNGLFEPTTATPEPSSSTLIVFGFAAMAALRKRVLL